MPATPKFTDPPAPARGRSVGPIPEAVVPLPDNQGDVVASLDPADDLSDLLPEQVVVEPPLPLPSTGSLFLIHILEDGFTASGQVWYRGQEIEYIIGEQAFEDTKDLKGVSWLLCDDAAQMKRWGRVMFRRGPWPGEAYEDPRAAAAELNRGRRPKALAGIAPPRKR